MSVVLKNVLLLGTTVNTAVATYSIKAFFLLYPEIRNRQFQKREGMEETQRSSVLYINNAATHCIYTERRGFIVSLTHLLVGVWRCLYFDD